VVEKTGSPKTGKWTNDLCISCLVRKTTYPALDGAVERVEKLTIITKLPR
jgi:hypothetical protein